MVVLLFFVWIISIYVALVTQNMFVVLFSTSPLGVIFYLTKNFIWLPFFQYVSGSFQNLALQYFVFGLSMAAIFLTIWAIISLAMDWSIALIGEVACPVYRYFRRKIKAIGIALLLVLMLLGGFYGSASAAPLRTVEAIVEYVYDGDTIRAVTKDGTELRTRLYGIDAPETAKSGLNLPAQPYGDEAARYLRKMVLGKRVTLRIMDIDRHRRMVAVVMRNNLNINLAMIESGAAECYREYLRQEPYRSDFMKAEATAQRMRRGIWSQDDYMRPSEYRRMNRIR
jgi:micrococcal nuclease